MSGVRRPTRPSIRPLVAVVGCLLLLSVSAGAAKKKQAAIVPPQMKTYVKAEYPAELKDRGLAGTVVLELDLDVNGAVSKTKVVESAGPQFDAAAVAAGSKLLFTPATADGKPLPVRIRFRYRFETQLAERRARSPGLGRYARRGPVQGPKGFSSLEGTLLERGTGRPVIGAMLLVPQLKVERVSDADGSFRFGALQPGKYAVQIESAEHRRQTGKIVIKPGRTARYDRRLTRNSYVIYRATARAPPQAGEMARRSISAEEIQRIPGVYGDAFKVVQNLPGVARQPAIGGALIVRGSAPEDTQVLIEGVRVPLLYHFANLYSVVNTDVLETIEFTPGGAAVRYGRKTGGLLQAKLKLPRIGERWKGYVETNVFHTGFILSGPIGERTNLTLAGRRSYIDLLLPLVIPDGALPFTVSPRYWDYQLKLDHQFSKKLDATVMFLGSDDQLRLVTDRTPAGFPGGNGDIQTTTGFHGVIGVLRARAKEWRARTTLGLVRTAGGFQVGTGSDLRFDITSWQLTARQDVELGEGPVKLRAGMDLFDEHNEVDILLPSGLLGGGGPGGGGGPPGGLQNTLDRQFNQKQALFSPALWVDAVFRMTPGLELVPGIRFDLYALDGNGATALPKFNVRYEWSKTLTLKGAAGMMSQVPQGQQLANTVGNPDLLPSRSVETALGFEYRPSERLSLDVQGFYKSLWDIPVSNDQANAAVPLINDMTGRVVGLEILLRHPPVGRFFGWLAYTLSQSTRTEHPGEDARLFEFDQTHILTAVASYKLPANWEASARFRLVSGNPYTDVETAIWRSDSDQWSRIQSACINCVRYPAFHQLDVRIDKKFVYDRWMFSLYLDVQNAYNRANPEAIQYNYDATEKAYQSLLPIIPSIGFKGEF